MLADFVPKSGLTKLKMDCIGPYENLSQAVSKMKNGIICRAKRSWHVEISMRRVPPVHVPDLKSPRVTIEKCFHWRQIKCEVNLACYGIF